jgi:hypothetical protein
MTMKLLGKVCANVQKLVQEPCKSTTHSVTTPGMMYHCNNKNLSAEHRIVVKKARTATKGDLLMKIDA